MYSPLLSKPHAITGLLLLILMTACTEHEVIREVNGSWNKSDDALLLEESVYKTTDRKEPHHHAPSSHSWSYNFWITDQNLENREEIFQLDNPMRYGEMRFNYLYWVSDKDKIVTKINRDTPVIIQIPDGTQTELTLSESQVEQLFGIPDVDLQDVHTAPSPDGEFVATFWTVAFSAGGTVMTFVHAVVFHDSNGNFLRKTRVPAEMEDGNVPRLNPPEEIDFYYKYVLWDKNSEYVYIMNHLSAYKVYVDENEGITETDMVPERALATNTGRVNTSGMSIQIEEEQNDATIFLEQSHNWIPYSQLEKVPFEEIDYN